MLYAQPNDHHVNSTRSLVYFDQNVFDHLLDAGLSAPDVAEAMAAHQLALVISEDNFQEWASCWKSNRREKELRGQQLLTYANALCPKSFLAPLPELLVREAISKIRHRIWVPFLSGAAINEAAVLLSNAARAGLSDGERNKMATRWAQKEAVAARFAAERNSSIVTTAADIWRGRTFEDFLVTHKNEQQQVATTILEGAFRFLGPLDETARKAVRYTVARLSKCKTLRTAVRTNLFVAFQLANDRRMPHDNWDDLRHCINATHVDVFVTRDEKLRDSCRQIRPGARVVAVREFAESIEIAYAGP